MKQYIEDLKSTALRQQEQRLYQASQPRLEKKKTQGKYQVLTQFLSEWWPQLTLGQQCRRYKLTEIAELSYGFTGRRPALRDLAEVLRRNGWEEIRSWKKGERNSRYWVRAPSIKS